MFERSGLGSRGWPVRPALALAATLTGLVVGLGRPPAATGEVPAGLELACPEGEVPESAFDDVPMENVHRHAIDCLAWERYGIVQGTSSQTFDPGGSVTRAQMAEFLRRTLDAAGATLPSEPTDWFTDDDESAFERSINQLAEIGVLAGVGDSRFAPADRVTRAQLATFLVQAVQATTSIVLPPVDDTFGDDDNSVHEYAIDLAAQLGLTTGTSDTTYNPGGKVRRDQLASFLARLLQLLLTNDVVGSDPNALAFVDDAYVSGPFRIRVVGSTITVNDLVVADLEPVVGAEPIEPPSNPSSVHDLALVGAAALRELDAELGRPPTTDEAEAAVRERLADIAPEATLTREGAGIGIENPDGTAAGVSLVSRQRGSERQSRSEVQQTAALWRQVLTSGGLAFTRDGATTFVSASRAASYLEELSTAIDAGEDEAVAELLGSAELANAVTATGSPPDEARRSHRTEASRSHRTVARSAPAGSRMGAHHIARVTPASEHAYLFAPIKAELLSICYTAEVAKALVSQRYIVHSFVGRASTISALVDASGKAGVLYACQHGDGMYEYVSSEEEAQAAAARYNAAGIRVVEHVSFWGHAYLHPRVRAGFFAPGNAPGWRPADNAIVFIDACDSAGEVDWYNAREFVGSTTSIITSPADDVFARLAGLAEDGESRHADAATGILNVDWAHLGMGDTTLSPAVRSHSPLDGQTFPDGTVNGTVTFDVAIEPTGSPQLGVEGLDGCTAQLISSAWADQRTLDFSLRITGEGRVAIRLFSAQLPSAYNGQAWLDGNQFPRGTDHVGPNHGLPGTGIGPEAPGDDYVWYINCSGSSQPTASPTPSPSPSPSPSATPTTRYELGVVIDSDQGVTIDPSAVTVNPSRSDYAAGENVTLSAQAEIVQDGLRHTFVSWEVSPPGTPVGSVDPHVINVTMESDVTVTANYHTEDA